MMFVGDQQSGYTSREWREGGEGRADPVLAIAIAQQIQAVQAAQSMQAAQEVQEVQDVDIAGSGGATEEAGMGGGTGKKAGGSEGSGEPEESWLLRGGRTFGKVMKTVQDLARQKAPIYNDNWVDYKQLKKLIKAISRAPETESKIEAGRLFFAELKTTLTKINGFYVARETELQGRYDSLVELDLNDADNFKAFVMFYNDLMFLKSWATTNTTAFDKITKKHDKKTG